MVRQVINYCFPQKITKGNWNQCSYQDFRFAVATEPIKQLVFVFDGYSVDGRVSARYQRRYSDGGFHQGCIKPITAKISILFYKTLTCTHCWIKVWERWSSAKKVRTPADWDVRPRISSDWGWEGVSPPSFLPGAWSRLKGRMLARVIFYPYSTSLGIARLNGVL